MGTTGQSITLANSIIGVGILAMPFCFQQCGALLATLILLFMGLVSKLCCYFLLKSALLARRRNFEFLAFHVFGPAGKLAVEVGIIGFLMGTCIAYFVVVGDLGPQIIAKMFNINQSDILRTSIMVIVSLVCVLPLGLLRNVDSLSNVSAATIGFYFCLVIKLITEAASQFLAGDWYVRTELWKPAGLLQCVPIFSMALFCQTQLFEIFESMPTLSLEKMNVVTKNAINICIGVYFTLGLFGYIAFCSDKISGNILMSLSPTMASDVIKLGFVMSLAFSFPLIIFPCRASLYSFLFKKVHASHPDHIINNSIPKTTFRCITVAIIAVSLFISLLIPNIELVLGLVGSTIGVLVCVVFPAACFVNITFKNTNERVLAKAIIVLGLVIMVLGTYANLQAIESNVDKYDDKYTPERINKIVEDFFEKMEKSDNMNGKALHNGNADAVKEIDKDSEIQPPNPVPPDSSVEKTGEAEIKPKETKLVQTNDEIDKVSETHPKNLKNKLNGLPKKSEENNAANEILGEVILPLEIKEKSAMEPEVPKSTNDKDKTSNHDDQDKNLEKNEIIKQQQLIETIKQHGEEQKELIKEQKEILDEIKKTKDELQQSKKDVDNIQAKKIAVESIQKIANMAIQSLSGVSDNPANQNENGAKVVEPIEKTANEAVQEIAKKAVETIEAIKEIQDKPKEQVLQTLDNKLNIPNVSKEVLNNDIPNTLKQSQSNINQIPVQNNVPSGQAANIPVNENLKQAVNVLKDNQHADSLIVQNIQPNPANAQDLGGNKETVLAKPVDNLPVQDNTISKQIVQNEIPIQNNVKENVQIPQNHLHAADEPQSYKQGEDVQVQNNNNQKFAQNIPPIPIVMSNKVNQQQQNVEATKIETSQQKPANKPNNNVNKQDTLQNNNNNGAIRVMDVNNKVESKIDNPSPIRQKREVVDCTKTMLLQPEDKEVCKTLIDKPNLQEKSDDIFNSKVDLNDVLNKNLPIDPLLHPNLRSLKSIDEKER